MKNDWPSKVLGYDWKENDAKVTLHILMAVATSIENALKTNIHMLGLDSYYDCGLEGCCVSQDKNEREINDLAPAGRLVSRLVPREGHKLKLGGGT